MPRKNLIRSKELPYHVCARANNKEPYYLPLTEVWKIFEEKLVEIEEKHDAKIHAFVLMSNHFHLLITSPTDDLGKVMETFMRSVTRTLNRKSNRSGRVFGGPYHGCIIKSHYHYDCVLKYIYRNPVKAKIAVSVESYEFTSLHSVETPNRTKFSIRPAMDLQTVVPDNDMKNFLIWLNQPFPNEVEVSIKNGIRQRIFRPSRIKGRKAKLEIYAQKNSAVS